MAEWVMFGRWRIDWSQVIAVELDEREGSNVASGYSRLKLHLASGAVLTLNDAESQTIKTFLAGTQPRNLDTGEDPSWKFH